MTKIDKIDIENIKLITEKTEIGKISKVKIKKGDYEIEISSESVSNQRPISEDTQTVSKINSENISVSEELNEENIVKSPMVGVAYLSADPDSAAYVKIGQHVKAGDTLILIEAMKTFNEIKAPKSGVIKKILALNSQPVEYGDHLIIFE
ncbi:MAG: acetyl-CoA carboxylase biotin carboxyl carrier protein [Pelagibacteraceae bacterium]|jgi:acetyl-CoA carboxylase biotin carboxyl carrier protein|nr:acetyl-CoA carboxylase biotin carboxyl carrier protein [Pelagibacteraceae bacterium]